MDITTLFKACVKTVRATNKSLGSNYDAKSSLLKTSARDSNLTKAKEITKQITYLQNFLLENKAAYLNVLNYLSTNKTMTEEDRIEIDNAAESIVSTCSTLISEYKKEIAKLPKTRQKEEHYNNVVETLEKYLKNVSKIYTEAKAIRVKRVIETHRLSKLETLQVKKQPNNDISDTDGLKKRRVNGEKPLTQNKVSEPKPLESYDDQLSIEEMQMFEKENESLYSELNSISDEVKQMESKVVHIAELQELFTEKVLQQEKDIERISETVASSTDNMRDANEQIRQAIQRNAGLRAWVLFFLLIMSFSLLFLDWYND